MNLNTLLKYFFSWRILVSLVGVVAFFVLPLRDGYTLLENKSLLQALSLMWANFDGIHYLNLIKYGYGNFHTGFLQAFFPLFPLTIGLINSLFNQSLLTSLTVNHLLFFASLFILYRLVKLDYDHKTANNTLILLLLFPVSFFFGSVYSESLYLFVSVLAVWFLRNKNFTLSAILIAFASATRLSGAFLIPLYFIEYFSHHKNNLKNALTDRNLIWLFVTPVGLLSYMSFLNRSVGDPFYFMTIQPLFGAQREVGRVILLHQVFYRYTKMILTVDKLSPLFFTVLLEALTGFVFLILSIFTFTKQRLSYAVYSFLGLVIPTLTGTFSSLPRYVMVLFPLFITMSLYYQKLPKRNQFAINLLLVILSIFAISLFTRGYFIS